jgi:hypothetical protein
MQEIQGIQGTQRNTNHDIRTLVKVEGKREGKKNRFVACFALLYIARFGLVLVVVDFGSWFGRNQERR